MKKPHQVYVLARRLDDKPHVFGVHDEPFLPEDLVCVLWAGRGPSGGRAFVVEVTEENLPLYLNHLGKIPVELYEIDIGRVKQDPDGDVLGS